MSCWAWPCRDCAVRRPPGTAGGRRRAGARVAALAGALLRGLARSAPRQREVLRTQARAIRALGATLEAPASVSGRRRVWGETGSLIVSDHISWLDALALLAVEPATALAKMEAAQWPLFGPLAERAGKASPSTGT